MSDEYVQVGSPEWWRDKLTEELRKRQPAVRRDESYYTGHHPLPDPPKRLEGAALDEARRAYRHMMAMGVTNWVKLVADAPSERLNVIGFKFGSDAIDARAWRIWQANGLDSDSTLTHDNALQTGDSFILVDPLEEVAPGIPLITCEHSSQAIVAYAPGSRRRRAAALKLWDDEDGRTFYATLYMPDGTYKWTFGAPEGWQQRRHSDDSAWPLPNPTGVVPMFEMAANPSLQPTLYGGGHSEFESVLPIQDRINKTVFDRLVTAEFQAFRQRWAVGWSPEADPATGLPRKDQIFKASQAFIWAFEGDPSEIKVGEFGQADFKQFIEATESDVNAMAAISKTPPHYLLGAMVNISGDALTAAESGLAAKTRKHARVFGEVWEDVMRFALRLSTESETDDVQAEVVWDDIEHRSWGEQVDAALKMKGLEVPREALWDRLPDVSPQTVEKWRDMRTEQMRTDPQPAAPTEVVEVDESSTPTE